ncbi:MAG: conjugal transfer transcriptional regulator TraJ [Pseudomonadota bacterium]
MTKKQSRRRVHHLRVPVLPSETTKIKQNAADCGLSVAAYLRSVGLQYKPKGILDYKAVGELVKVNADLGRLGGLLKMWLSNDERLGVFNKESLEINELLQEIQLTQSLLLETARKV